MQLTLTPTVTLTLTQTLTRNLSLTLTLTLTLTLRRYLRSVTIHRHRVRSLDRTLKILLTLTLTLTLLVISHNRGERLQQQVEFQDERNKTLMAEQEHITVKVHSENNEELMMKVFRSSCSPVIGIQELICI